MKKSYVLLLFLLFPAIYSSGQFVLTCDFTVAPKACINQEVKVIYAGNATPNASYQWDFDGATIISGAGQGPFFVKWASTGEKHITLTVNFEGQTCTKIKPVVVIETPAMFHMTGGGVYIPGTPGVEVGLSGSEAGIIYKLRLNGQYNGVAVVGTGQPISFGPRTVPGHYTALARVDGSDCQREMEGVAIVTLSEPPLQQNICMVTFDTAQNRNRIIWHKHPGPHLSHYNIYKETYQNNQFARIAEVPYSNLSTYADPVSDPLVKSDKYKISVSDSAGNESEKSPYHKTIHLNINPGIFGFNLIWNHYEGFEFQTYRIHRKHATGGWEVIDSIASNVDSYTDFYTEPGTTTYYIEAVRPEPCTPSLKDAVYMRVISNTASSAPLGIGEGNRSGLLAYPNPVSDNLTLVLPGAGVYRVEIFRPDGVPVLKGIAQGPKDMIRVSEFSAGFYLLRITGENLNSVSKFVKN